MLVFLFFSIHINMPTWSSELLIDLSLGFLMIISTNSVVWIFLEIKLRGHQGGPLSSISHRVVILVVFVQCTHFAHNSFLFHISCLSNHKHVYDMCDLSLICQNFWHKKTQKSYFKLLFERINYNVSWYNWKSSLTSK